MPSTPHKHRPSLDDRLDELNRQLREIRKAVKAAERGRPVSLPSIATNPAARSSAAMPPPAAPEPGRSGGLLPAAPASPPAAPASLATQPRPAGPETGRPPPTGAFPPRGGSAGRPAPGLSGEKEQFARFFSGTFIGGPATAHDQRVYRNRAIVMLCVVIVVGYVVFSLLAK